MVRGMTARFVLTALSAVLLALQLFAPTASAESAESAESAHQVHVTVPAPPDVVTAKPTDDADEVVTCGDFEHPTSPTGPLRTRDRHRAMADSQPEPRTLVLLTHDVTAAPPLTARPASPQISRSSTAYSAAALQVFRC